MLINFLASVEVSYKNRLQEYLQKKHLDLPFYETEKLTTGLFRSSLKIKLTTREAQVYHGKECTTKKAAEQSAAQKVCRELKLS